MMISTEESSQLKHLKENTMEPRPTNKTSESPSPTGASSVTETIEVVPEVGACYTIVEEHGDVVSNSGFDISSDDDKDRMSTDNSDGDISGYDGDVDIAQWDVSEIEQDSDAESRVTLAKKLRLKLYKKGVDSIRDAPPESLFESVGEDCDGLNSDELTSDCLGTGYTDEFETDSEDTRLVKWNKNFDAVDKPNVDGNLTPNKFVDHTNSGLVKRKLYEENFEVIRPPMIVDGNLVTEELLVVEHRKNSGLVKRKLSEDEDCTVFLRILAVKSGKDKEFYFYRSKKAK